MRKGVFAAAIVLALAAAVAGVWLAVRESGGAPEVVGESASDALRRALVSESGVAAAPWVRGGAIGEGGESGNYAFYKATSADGRVAWVYLVRLAAGDWRVVSLTEGPPQCAAVERFGFPSAMIADCRVGEAQTVAEALALAIAGEDVSGVRLVGTIELPPDPGCGCVLLTSGGASVRLNLSAAELAVAGIRVGDTVVVAGGLGGDLSVDATSAILATPDGTPAGAPGSGGSGQDRDGEGKKDSAPGTKAPSAPAPEPAGSTPVAPGAGVTGGSAAAVPGFPEWKPRRRYATTWYANPLDLDSSAAEEPSLSGS